MRQGWCALFAVGEILLSSASLYAAPPDSSPTPATPAAPSKIDVDSLKKKYWEFGAKNLSVVQNRAYTKAKRINIGITGGTITNDPFLNTYNYGGILGYNFSEYVSINFLYWRIANSKSSANNSIPTGFGANVNPIQSIMGGEVAWSILYGKLSLLGISIIHFDLRLMGGVGMIAAQNGNSIAPWLGIGPQAFLSHSVSLSVDYRLMRYQENVVEMFVPSTLGQVVGNRVTYSGAFCLGLNLFLF